MTALAAFLALALVSPQDKETQKADPRFTSVLTPAEQKQLNQKLRAWFDAAIDLGGEEAGSGAKREALRKKEKDAQDAFDKDREKIEKTKGDLRKHLGDFKAILENAVPFKSQQGFGEVKSIKPKDAPAFNIVVPKGYREVN